MSSLRVLQDSGSFAAKGTLRVNPGDWVAWVSAHNTLPQFPLLSLSTAALLEDLSSGWALMSYSTLAIPFCLIFWHVGYGHTSHGQTSLRDDLSSWLLNIGRSLDVPEHCSAGLSTWPGATGLTSSKSLRCCFPMLVSLPEVLVYSCSLCWSDSSHLGAFALAAPLLAVLCSLAWLAFPCRSDWA